MKLLYPLGFLALLAVPVLILIYVIKNKYTEQVIPSTYLWRLSERFLKRRLPISKLARILSLILQILSAVFIAVAISQPVFTIRASASSYCFVLDGSGSMNILTGNVTRFEAGKAEIAKIIKKSNSGSEFTLVYAGDYTETVFEGISDKKQALALLDRLTVAYSFTGLERANGIAREIFEANPSVLTYLITDKEVEGNENVRVIDVSSEVENYALRNVRYTVTDKLTAEGEVVSYGSAATVTVECCINGSGQPLVADVEVGQASAAPFKFEFDATDFETIRLAIKNTDALAFDNEAILYSALYENSYGTLLVSDDPFFLQAVLKTAGNVAVDTVSTKEYVEGTDGYGLYIFDTFTPAKLPSDGAVWFINPTKSVADSGFSVQRSIGRDELKGDAKLQYSSSSASVIRTLLNEVVKKDVTVSRYVKCSQYLNFDNILTCNGNPAVFTGANAFNNREVVFAFKLNDSNFTLMPDFLTLCLNLLDYIFPTVLEKTSYVCGDTLSLNVPADCDRVRISSPKGNKTYPDVSSVNSLTLNEVGTYTVTLFDYDNFQKDYSVYVSFPEEERTAEAAEPFGIVGEAENNKLDGTFDGLIIIYILLAVVFVTDWAVYCYEQYQLR